MIRLSKVRPAKFLLIMAVFSAAAGLSGCGGPLHGAAKTGDVIKLRQLLDAGMNIEVWNQGADKWTPLMYAVHYGQKNTVKELLSRGANPTAVGSGGTALAIAQRKGNAEMIRMVSEASIRWRGRRISSAPAVVRRSPARVPAPQRRTVRVSDIDSPEYSLIERADDFAIVVGIDDYKDLPSAQYAERDADAMRNHLIAMGYPKRHVILLKGPNATRTGLQKYLEEWLPRNVKPTSNVFFYYSGHGAPDVGSGKAYLVPWDGDASFLKSTAYPIEKLYASLNQLKAKQIIVVIDACFSGAGGRSVLAKGTRPLVTRVDEGLSRKGRIALFAAASGDEVTATLEEEGHGIFTYFFLKGLGGEAKDRKGRVTAKSLYRYLKPKVQDEARLQNREQTPKLHSKSNVILRAR